MLHGVDIILVLNCGNIDELVELFIGIVVDTLDSLELMIF